MAIRQTTISLEVSQLLQLSRPQTLDGCGKAAGAENPMHTAHTQDPSLKNTSQSLPGCGAPTKTSEEMIDETIIKSSSDKTWTDKNGKVWQEGDLSGQDIKFRDDNRQHIFDDREGHFVDTQRNRDRIVVLVEDLTKYLGDDYHGNWWYAEILPDGKQLWGQTRGEKIINCGLNETPEEYNPRTGLCNYDPSKQKNKSK